MAPKKVEDDAVKLTTHLRTEDLWNFSSAEYYKAEKRDVALERIKRRWLLNSVSSQCVSGKWSIAQKPEVHPENF